MSPTPKVYVKGCGGDSKWVWFGERPDYFWTTYCCCSRCGNPADCSRQIRSFEIGMQSAVLPYERPWPVTWPSPLSAHQSTPFFVVAGCLALLNAWWVRITTTNTFDLPNTWADGRASSGITSTRRSASGRASPGQGTLRSTKNNGAPSTRGPASGCPQ